MGVVSNKKILSLNDMNDIKIAEKITKKKFQNDNKIYDIFSSLKKKLMHLLEEINKVAVPRGIEPSFHG